METQVEAQVMRRLFTADEFHAMAEAGILHEDDRIELIEGELIELAAIGTKHFTYVNMLNCFLVRSVGDEGIVSVQNPVRLHNMLEPQPDLVVVKDKYYSDALPGPEDVLLLIEVSDTTPRHDRETKLPLYARSGVGEAWIRGSEERGDGAPHRAFRERLPACPQDRQRRLLAFRGATGTHPAGRRRSGLI